MRLCLHYATMLQIVRCMKLRWSGSSYIQSKCGSLLCAASTVEGNPAATEEAPAAPPPLPISQLDIRVGRVIEISKHPDADS